MPSIVLLFSLSGSAKSSLPSYPSRLPVKEHRHRRKEQSCTEEILGMDTVIARIRGSVLLSKGYKHSLTVPHVREGLSSVFVNFSEKSGKTSAVLDKHRKYAAENLRRIGY